MHSDFVELFLSAQNVIYQSRIRILLHSLFYGFIICDVEIIKYVVQKSCIISYSYTKMFSGEM